MTDIHLEHAYLTVTNLERSIAFYEILLPGWKVRWRGQTSSGERWVHFGDPSAPGASYLSLAEAPGATRVESGLAIDHLGFTHPDVASLTRRAVAAGLPTPEVAEDERFARRYFKDPDGHEIEFVEAR